MFRNLAVVSAMAAIILSAMAAPASANSVPTTGNRITFFPTPTTSYPADTPFYVESGFACTFPDVSTCTNNGTSFTLLVDGVQQPSQKDVDNTVFDGFTVLDARYLTNFPQGLSAGPHTFTGVYYVNGSFFDEVTMTVNFT
jgi:hypothetical protein